MQLHTLINISSLAAPAAHWYCCCQDSASLVPPCVRACVREEVPPKTQPCSRGQRSSLEASQWSLRPVSADMSSPVSHTRGLFRPIYPSAALRDPDSNASQEAMMLIVPLCSANMLSSCLILIISVPEMFSTKEPEAPPEPPAAVTTFVQQRGREGQSRHPDPAKV